VSATNYYKSVWQSIVILRGWRWTSAYQSCPWVGLLSL